MIDDKNILAKVLEINRLLTKSLDLDVILKTLVQAAKDLVQVADTTILYFYEPQENVLKMAEGVGVDKKWMKKLSFLPGESLTGITFIKKEPLLFSHPNQIKKSMSNMSAENYRYYLKGVYGRQVQSAFCVPLLYQETCLGVLVVDNFENEGYFTEHDMSMIKVIADQSAIAISNSQLVQNLKQKNKELSESLDIHRKFTQVILDGGGVETILTLLSRILSSNVRFRDTDPMDAERNEEASMLFPIIQGSENYGYIQLERPLSTLSPIERIATEHAATALALELVKQNALYEKELHFREEFFNQMIDGMPLGQLPKMASQLKWDSKWLMQCMVIEGKNEPLWSSNILLSKEKFVKSVEKICQRYTKYGLVFTKAFQTVIVAPVLQEEVMERIARQLVQSVENKKPILCGIGRKTYLNRLIESYQEAMEAVRYGKSNSNQDNPIISYSLLGAERLWQKVDANTLQNFVNDKLGPVLSMGKEYFTTLATYIELNKSSKKTSDQLHVHPNTLYYRLKKIEQRLQISLEDEKDWLDLLLAYQIHVSINKS